MKYTKLGRTGIDVSRICLGCMSYGLDRADRRAERIELDAVEQDLPQRIAVERVELIRREQPRHQFEENEPRRLRHRVIAKQAFQ